MAVRPGISSTRRRIEGHGGPRRRGARHPTKCRGPTFRLALHECQPAPTRGTARRRKRFQQPRTTMPMHLDRQYDDTFRQFPMVGSTATLRGPSWRSFCLRGQNEERMNARAIGTLPAPAKPLSLHASHSGLALAWHSCVASLTLTGLSAAPSLVRHTVTPPAMLIFNDADH